MADPGFSYTPSATSQPVAVEQKSRVLQALKGSASWFGMIAGLSVVNSILAMSGTSVRFIFGLGLSQIVDALAHQAGSTGYVLDLIINGIIAGVFVLFWNFARKGEKWAWYLAIAFHAYALYRMSSGLKLLPILERLNQQSATGAISGSF